MTRALRLPTALVLAITAAGIAAVWWAAAWHRPRPDVVGANDLVRVVTAAWPDVESADLAGPFPAVSVVTVPDSAAEKPELVAHTGPPITDDRAALRAGASAWGVTVDGRRVGTVYLVDTSLDQVRDRTDRGAWVATIALLTVALVVTALLVRLDARVLRPFRRLEGFAADVAAGRLDTPLPQDRADAFGAFSQAFDLLRDQLAEAREQERRARQSKTELVAQLTHDIRTPVASIATTAELLALGEDDPARRERLEVVLAKADQIRQLVDDLRRAGADEIDAMVVRPEELASDQVATLLRRADPSGTVRDVRLPECLVEADPLRLAQVFDNVLANAAKYAGTAVDVTGRIIEDALTVRIRDHGPGLPAAELDSVLGMGVRGSAAGDTPGLGLGLYTAGTLLERMGGSLHLERGEPGLVVVVYLPLAGLSGQLSGTRQDFTTPPSVASGT